MRQIGLNIGSYDLRQIYYGSFIDGAVIGRNLESLYRDICECIFNIDIRMHAWRL